MHNHAPTQPPSPDQYGFINNQGPTPKKGLFNTPNTPKGRAILMGGIVGAIIIVMIIFFSILGSIDAGKKEQWLKVAQKQQEIIRISELGVDDAQTSEVKNLAANINLTFSSSSSDINSLVSKSGAKLTPAILAKGKDASVDTKLETALQSNQFDETFRSLIKAELVEYQVLLKNVHGLAKNDTTKTILASEYDNAETLASQASQ